MQKIAIDMDEVIADSFSKLCEIYCEETGEELENEEESLYRFLEKGGKKTLHAYPHREGFFRNLQVIEGSQQVLEQLNKKYKLYIVSAATEFDLSMNDKIAWLKDHFPFLGWKQVVFCGDKSIIDADFLIDDHVKNLKGFNGKGYLFHAPHNIKESGYERVRSWKEVEEIFL
jgi:5'-nucleotidase